MGRTKPLTLILLVVLGVGIGWLVQTALTSMGRPVFTPPLSLTLVLAVIGAGLVAMAWPVRRVVKKVAGAKVDPFYATRVVTLAKASSLSGSLLGGAALGMVAFLLTRPVPPVGSVSMAVAMVVGALVLTLGALVAEHMCTLPPDDGEQARDAPQPRGI